MKTLISQNRLRRRVSSLARQISRDFRGKELVMVVVLKGAFVFFSDLIRRIKLPVMVDFIRLSSYGPSTASSGKIRVIKDIELSVAGKDVLIVEDIIDSGRTMDFLVKHLKRKKARSVEVCSLLDKPARRAVSVRIDYRGFIVPDKFLFGYGLDLEDKYRNLPDIAYLETG